MTKYNGKPADKWKLALFEEILDNINEGIIATNRDGEIIVYNKQLAEFEGLNKDEVLGKKLGDVYEWCDERSEHMQVLKTGEVIKESNYHTIIHNGHQVPLVATTIPLICDGKALAAFSVSRNVTKIREMYNRTIALIPKAEKDHTSLDNGTRYTFEDILFESKKMETLVRDSQKAALSPSPVMIVGETGTGKELIAQSIHNAGQNKAQPFIGINCAAIPEGLLESMLFGTTKGAFTGAENMSGFFEQAKDGTVYLDEINSMPLNLQAKLLRVIQEKTYRKIGDNAELPLRCQIISSLNKDPLACVLSKELREDLYYRLSVIILTIPPLRERREDIRPLAEYFVKKYREIYGKAKVEFPDELKDLLTAYLWPGNVRELEHVIEQAISMMDDDGPVKQHDLPAYLRMKLNIGPSASAQSLGGFATLKEALLATERETIIAALAKSGNNISEAAKNLGIKRQNLQYRIKKLNIR